MYPKAYKKLSLSNLQAVLLLAVLLLGILFTASFVQAGESSDGGGSVSGGETDGSVTGPAGNDYGSDDTSTAVVSKVGCVNGQWMYGIINDGSCEQIASCGEVEQCLYGWGGEGSSTRECALIPVACGCSDLGAQTLSRSCPSGQTGAITDTRNHTCAAGWSAWTTVNSCSTTGSGSDVCTNLSGIQSAVPSGYASDGAGNCTTTSTGSCTPASAQTRTVACPSGLAGSVTERRTSTCPGPTWSAWSAVSDTCGTTSETCSISATLSTIPAGDSSTLAWTCSESTSASGGNFSTGGASTGSRTVTPSVTTTYSLQCSAGCSASAQVIVVDPSLTIQASPSRVRFDTTSLISWTASGVSSCSVFGPNSATAVFGSGVSGSKLTSGLRQQSIYTLVCQTPVGQRTASATVIVTPSFCETGSPECPE